jgi:hypothetical protein
MRPKLGSCLGVINSILNDDKKSQSKQLRIAKADSNEAEALFLNPTAGSFRYTILAHNRQHKWVSTPLQYHHRGWIPVFSSIGRGHYGLAAQAKALPKSIVGKAAKYTLSLLDKLTRFLEYPVLELSNNLADNSIRP